MNRVSEVVLNFLLNAAWQIAAIAFAAFVCSWLLRNIAARYRHSIWVVALLLSFALPVWSLFSFENNASQKASVRATSSKSTALATSEPVPLSVASSIQRPAENLEEPSSVMQSHKRNVSIPNPLLFALMICYGVLLLYRLTRLLQAWRKAKQLSQFAYEPANANALIVELKRCQAAFRVRKVTLKYSRTVMFPVTLGIRKPLIIIPESLQTEQSDETIVSIIGHEMAHIARRDWALNLAYEFLLLPISFHPLANLIKQQINKTRELACDDMVAERLLGRFAYARSLIRVAGRLVSPSGQALTLGMFDADILEERIMKLTRNKREFGARATRFLVLSAFLLLCFVGTSISTLSFDLRLQDASAQTAAKAIHNRRNGTLEAGLNENQSTSLAQDKNGLPATQIDQATAVRSKDAQERASAACNAGKNRQIQMIPELISMLGDDARIQPIRCWENGTWNPALDTFKSPSPGEQAAIALASMGSPAFGPLTNALSDGNSSVRRNAAWAIGELTQMEPGERTEAVPALIILSTDSDEWVRTAAARALGEVRDKRAGQALINSLSDRFSQVREVAAWALSELKDEHAVQALCKLLLEDAQPDVRQTAAMALGEIRSTKAIESLKQALHDPELSVRAKAEWALEEIEDSDG